MHVKTFFFPTAFYLIPKLFICYTDKYCIVFIVGGGMTRKVRLTVRWDPPGANIPTDKSQMGALRGYIPSRGLLELADNKYEKCCRNP